MNCVISVGRSPNPSPSNRCSSSSLCASESEKTTSRTLFSFIRRLNTSRNSRASLNSPTFWPSQIRGSSSSFSSAKKTVAKKVFNGLSQPTVITWSGVLNWCLDIAFSLIFTVRAPSGGRVTNPYSSKISRHQFLSPSRQISHKFIAILAAPASFEARSSVNQLKVQPHLKPCGGIGSRWVSSPPKVRRCSCYKLTAFNVRPLVALRRGHRWGEVATRSIGKASDRVTSEIAAVNQCLGLRRALRSRLETQPGIAVVERDRHHPRFNAGLRPRNCGDEDTVVLQKFRVLVHPCRGKEAGWRVLIVSHHT